MKPIGISYTLLLEQAHKRMQGLQHITSELSRANTKHDVAQIIIDEAFKVLQADGDVAMMDENNQPYVIAYKGYPKTFFRKLPHLITETPPILTLRVVQERKPYFVPNVNNLPSNFKLAKIFFAKAKTKSLALLPLKIDNKIFGVLEFSFREIQNFSHEDKDFMITLAQQCSQAFERVTAQEKLAESKKELEIILGTVADGIIVQSEGGKIVYANKAVGNVFKEIKFQDFFKYSWEEFLNLFDIEDEQGNRLAHTLMPGRRAIAARKPVKVTYKFTHKKSQEARWLQIESTGIASSNKKTSISVSVFQDITKLKEIEQRKDDFISIASHELKTPLTSAKVFTQVLKKKLLTKKLNEEEILVNKIDRQLDQLHDLTKDLLDITKLQKGKLELAKTKFVLGNVIEEIIDDLQPSTEHKIRFSQGERIFIYADKEKIAQVITNFITNAIKYSPDTERIDIRVHKNTSGIKVSIKDRGIGISTHDVDKIFERFYRIEKDKKTYPGLGLGLYISSEIIKQHGGDIGVKSEKGKGSTFYFVLPLDPNR